MHKTVKALTTAGLTALLLAGCVQNATMTGNPGSGGPTQAGSGGAEGDGKPEQGPPPAFTRFSDIPVPESAEMNLDRSVVFGANEKWNGRLVLTTPHSAQSMFDFYKAHMPEFGWSEVTSIRSRTSVLTYRRQSRVATIQIAGGNFQGSQVDFTVSPEGAGK